MRLVSKFFLESLQLSVIALLCTKLNYDVQRHKNLEINIEILIEVVTDYAQ